MGSVDDMGEGGGGGGGGLTITWLKATARGRVQEGQL